MKNPKLSNLLFSGPENTNRNQNFNNINIINLNNSNIYDNSNQKDQYIKTEISQNNNNHNLSFCTKGEKNDNTDYYGNQQTEVLYDFYNETTSTNKIFDYGNCTDVNIKNKIMNINSSLKSFNIQVKNKVISYADFENFKNKNAYINNLLDYIVDLIWIIKDERSLKNEFVQKLQSNNFKNDEYERKIKKLNSDLSDTKKYLNNALNKNINEKDKNNIDNFNNKKSNGDMEINLYALKAENKKLNSQITVLKNEIKKKELEFSKLQEKVKKLLNEKIAIPNSITGLNNSFTNNNTFNPIGTQRNIPNNNSSSVKFYNNLGNDIFKLSSLINYDLGNKNLGDSILNKNSKTLKNENLNKLKNLYKKFLDFNTQTNIKKKYDSLLNQNEVLMSILFNFQESLDKINQKIIYFNKNNTKIKEELLELIKLKENIFSLHLIDKELLNEFSDNFFENIKVFEDIILRIMEYIFYENSELKEKYKKLEIDIMKIKGKQTINSNNNSNFINENYDSKDSNLNKDNNSNGNINKEKDIIKNLKRWSMNKNSLNIPNPPSNKNSDRKMIRNSSFAGRILENNFEENYSNIGINKNNENKTKRNSSLNTSNFYY